MAPVPILLCGKSAMLASSFADSLLPDYDVVHVCHSLDAGIREIPALLRGEHVSSESDLGSNTKLDQHVVPKAIVVGKGFSEQELETLRSHDGMQVVPWLVPDDKNMTWTRVAKAAGTAGVALPGIIAERVTGCMREHGMVPGSETTPKPELWGF